jgi:hypothetical protein
MPPPMASQAESKKPLCKFNLNRNRPPPVNPAIYPAMVLLSSNATMHCAPSQDAAIRQRMQQKTLFFLM